jgi:hypothetical protein
MIDDAAGAKDLLLYFVCGCNDMKSRNSFSPRAYLLLLAATACGCSCHIFATSPW